MKSPWIEGDLTEKEMQEIWKKEGKAAAQEKRLEARRNDSFFRDTAVYDGPVPSDLSLRHDDYLYGSED